eukprot:1751997-Rhodomonas_salina.2
MTLYSLRVLPGSTLPAPHQSCRSSGLGGMGAEPGRLERRSPEIEKGGAPHTERPTARCSWRSFWLRRAPAGRIPRLGCRELTSRSSTRARKCEIPHPESGEI